MKSYKERYKDFVNSVWFDNAYLNKSLGSAVIIEQDNNINLIELEIQLEEALNKETKESMTEWLNSKRI